VGHGETLWRVFCAVELPQLARERALRHIGRLRETAPAAKASWSRKDNLHLTLKFLGEIPIASVADFSTAVSRAIARVRQPHNAVALATAHKQMEFSPLEIPVSEVLVIRSELIAQDRSIR
jgi:2'-5' RNA ligase